MWVLSCYLYELLTEGNSSLWTLWLFIIDNVTLHLDGVLYLRVVDPFKVGFTWFFFQTVNISSVFPQKPQDCSVSWYDWSAIITDITTQYVENRTQKLCTQNSFNKLEWFCCYKFPLTQNLTEDVGSTMEHDSLEI